MPIVASIDAFLEVARKSNQIDGARLDAFLQAQPSLPAEPRKLAALLIREGLITLFQAEQFLQGKHKGFQIGGYRVLDRIGAGGAGTVYLAEHELMKRRAAIKVLPTPLAEDPVIVERFRIEAQAAAALDHPNVVHLYDFSKEGRLHYIVMEYVDGPNLQQVIARKGPLNIALACEYARQAALGLGHAHQAGMVHRDVKPANILIDSGGTIKVLDLGLARVEGADGESVTRKFNSGAVLGTADYLAPEQALDLHDVDGRADIYSLGATLYALLTGRPPFDTGTIGQKLMWHQTKAPEPAHQVRPEIPAELSALVARMLSKRPEDRPATMDDIAQALAPWADQAPRPEGRGSGPLAEIHLGGPRTARLAPGVTGRLGRPIPDTWVNAADQDTAKIDRDEQPSPLARPLRDITLGLDRASTKLLVLGGLIALVSGLVGGVVAFLLWGPRP